jgi:hypothetical protein
VVSSLPAVIMGDMDSTHVPEDGLLEELTTKLEGLLDLDPAELPDPAGQLAEELAEALDELDEERPD